MRQNGGQAVGSPQVRPSPRPRPPQNFAAGVNNIQAVPGNTAGTPNPNPAARPAPNPASAAFIHRLCTQAGINIQQFQSMNQQQQQAFLTTQATIMRQQTTRTQGGNGGGTPNPLGAGTTPGVGRPQQQQARGSPAMPVLQPPPDINGMNAQQAAQLVAGPMPNQAQAAAALTAAAAGNNSALQARLLQMRAQGHAIPQGLQNQLAAAAAAAAVQNAGQGGNSQGGGQGSNVMMGQLPQTQGAGNQNAPVMNNQSPHLLPNSLPPAQQGPAQNPGFPGLANGLGTPGSVNGLNPANGSSPGEQQRAYQEISNILANLPEFLKMKDENRLNDQQMKMVSRLCDECSTVLGAKPCSSIWMRHPSWIILSR
ncbi:hypothetical protein QFC22_002442 [Naganishia vaughanmartiniae]|uniref:Uncharacterized protein n=1 Tax=Naganishia vaughanmartiniae TaxID=1424756 RepID=A0ACC2XEF9_9TREE|nr:hypothetical protein QFC22_002442 [Naganishia vaughanmartiniae]